MDETRSTLLPARGVVTLAGADRVTFLQGLVSNDVLGAIAQHAVYAALLTPQGKFLFEMFIFATENKLWLDVEAAQADALIAKLNKYKLRSDVQIVNQSADYGVAIATDDPAQPLSAPDPRLAELGWRIIAPRAQLPAENNAMLVDYEALRLQLGVADGSRDMVSGDSILLEGNFDYLNGVDFGKGCYMGQELTARTHYRGLIKKRLFPVKCTTGPCPPPGTLLYHDGQEAGVMRSSRGDHGIALLKTELAASHAPLTAGETALTAHIPNWVPAKT